MRNFLFLLLFVSIAAVPVRAEPPGWAAFVNGNFEAARAAGRADGSAEGLAHACRAGLVLGGFKEKSLAATKTLHSAIADCNKALHMEPNHFFAKMSLAIALSYEGKRLKRPSHPQRAKAYILELVEQEPQNPLGYGALAAWHSEVSAAGFLARIALGARRKKAEENFRLAKKHGAMDYALQFEYVKFLARGNKKMRQKGLTEARALLDKKAATAFDKLLEKSCERLMIALEKNSKRELKSALLKASAFQNASSERDIPRFPLENLMPLTVK